MRRTIAAAWYGAAVDVRPRTTAEASGERRDLNTRERLVGRVAAEFREMPGMRLTSTQAGRLFGLRSDVCGRLISRLVRDGVLRRDGEGRYVTV
jgi:hypothetical protein